MKIQPVLIIGPDGLPLQSLQPSDLSGLAAQEALLNVNALLNRTNNILMELPKAPALVHQITIDLAAPVVNMQVPVGPLTSWIRTVVVKKLVGTASMKFSPNFGGEPVTLAQGEVRDGLMIELMRHGGLILDSPGSAGGTITLELQGR